MPFPDAIEYSTHGAQKRLYHRYSREDVRQALRHGTVIEQYPDTGRGESYLLLHWIDERPIHVVAADKEDGAGFRTIIITVYDPRTEPQEWSDDFRERRDDDSQN